MSFSEWIINHTDSISLVPRTIYSVDFPSYGYLMLKIWVSGDGGTTSKYSQTSMARTPLGL